MKQLLSILILLTLFSCKNTGQSPLSLHIDVSADIVIPKHYIVPKCNMEINIDGIADEAIWASTPFSDPFIDIEGIKIPKYNTRVKLLWDANYLYVYSEMEEPHIWGDITERDAVIFYNNDFEVFINPSGDTRNYGEIEINALGTIWDLSLDQPYRNQGKANNHWNLHSLKSAVKIYGSLNDPSDIDSLWTIEMAIPMKALVELGKKSETEPGEGIQWRLNFSRVEWEHDLVDGKYQRKKEKGKYLDEYNWVWTNQKVINMHEPEKWGFIQFTEQSSSDKITFREDPDLLIKQVAYALFRQTRAGSLKKLLKQKAGYKQEIKVKYSEDQSINSIFYKTNFGFEFKLFSPHTRQLFFINEEGLLKTK